MVEYRPGTAPIKAAFVRPAWPARSEPLDGRAAAQPDASAVSRATVAAARPVEDAQGGATTPADAPAAQPTPAEEPPRKKRARGQNKNRQFARTDDEVPLCTQLARGACSFGDAYVCTMHAHASCRFGHDLAAYLTHKPRDIHTVPAHSGLLGAARDAYLALLWEQAVAAETPAPPPELQDPIQHSLDFSTYCAYFAQRGACPAGWKCRFLGAHVRRVGPSRAVTPEANGTLGTGLELATDDARVAAWRARDTSAPGAAARDSDELNWLEPHASRALRTRKYTYDKTPAILDALRAETQALSKLPPDEAAASPVGKGPLRIDYAAAARERRAREAARAADTEEALEAAEDELRNAAAAAAAADTARVRPCEKRRLQWRGELYLAPLTTTGNLPFRRLCAGFGSDIHCGEMGLAESFVGGSASEWSLVRRWEGERTFGTQVCGAKPDFLVPAAEVLAREVGAGLDFVDVNCGCPIDLVYNKGAGSALLDHANKLGRIVRGMNAALGEIPLTIKLRTGTTAKQTTHKIFARAQTEWGVGAMTLHGRSRKQRYKNDADWGYIGTCVDVLRSSVRTWNEEARHADEPEMVPVPVYGNGDVFGWRDYYEDLERTGVDGTMIARGALIKPWIFTEIKERRDWDISSRERLDLVRQFAEYGLTHWGADTPGVNTTRRFLCEMLSFTHRYVPIGLLEHVPVRMNDRPPPFQGRDSLESLLSSPSAADWVRISEMFLGPAPPNWHFLRTCAPHTHTAKHKSNAFETDAELQG